jgi:hypothetical protein
MNNFILKLPTTATNNKLKGKGLIGKCYALLLAVTGLFVH